MSRTFMRIPIFLLFMATLSSCATQSVIDNKLRKISAGHTGCMPENNLISDYSSDYESASWIAECNGQRYLCSGVKVYEGATVNCALAVE